MPISPILLVAILAVILLFFLWLFLFRGQSNEDRMLGNELKRLYSDKSGEQTTLLWHTQEEPDGSMRAYVMWMNGYEQLDPARMDLPRSFDEYGALEKEDGVRWRLPWEEGSPQMVLTSSQSAFEEKLRELTASGWEIQLIIPFSDRNQVVFLSR